MRKVVWPALVSVDRKMWNVDEMWCTSNGVLFYGQGMAMEYEENLREERDSKS